MGGQEVLDRATEYTNSVAFENKNEHGYYNFRATSYSKGSGDKPVQTNFYYHGDQVAYIRNIDGRTELVVLKDTSIFAIKIEEDEAKEILDSAEEHLKLRGEHD